MTTEAATPLPGLDNCQGVYITDCAYVYKIIHVVIIMAESVASWSQLHHAA